MTTDYTFSELLAKIPKDRRNRQACVLLALWLKGAISEATAITSRDVGGELRAHMRSKAPSNVSDILAKSSPEVERIPGAGRHFRWYLTRSGFGKLRSLGVPASVTEAPKKGAFDYDVAFVCALHDPELTALLRAFGGETYWKNGLSSGQQHIYKETEYSTDRGEQLRIVAGAPTYMGLTATAILATQMILSFRPRFIAMVGIAAGTRGKQRGYGDILVADPSVDYASGKVSYRDGTEVFQPDPFPLPIHAALRTRIQEDSRTRSGLDQIRSDWPEASPTSGLRLHIGPVGAADQVVDSAERVEAIQKNWRKLIGVEMETYALYRAAYEAPSPQPLYASFKSVCDFATGKSDDWQEYAAFTSAQYARQFLSRHWNVIHRTTLS